MVLGYSFEWDYESLMHEIKEQCSNDVDMKAILKQLQEDPDIHVMMEIAYIMACSPKPNKRWQNDKTTEKRAELLASLLLETGVLHTDFFYESDIKNTSLDDLFDDIEDIPTPDEFVDCPHTYEAV